MKQSGEIGFPINTGKATMNKIYKRLKESIFSYSAKVSGVGVECCGTSSSLNTLRSTDFLLDTDTKLDLLGPSTEIGDFCRWQNITHCNDKRTALVMVAGDILRPTNLFTLERDSKLFIRYTAGLSIISNDGLILELCFMPVSGQAEPVVFMPLPGGPQASVWHQLEMDLSFLHGKKGFIEISVNSGTEGDPSSDWVAIADLCVSRVDRLPLVMASSHHKLRVRNELQHFSRVYRHDMYTENKGGSIRNKKQMIRKLQSSLTMPIQEAVEGIATDIEALPGESTYDYVYRLLYMALPIPAPDFVARLKARSSSSRKKIRVLSICCGAARIEAGFAAQVGDVAEWSLFDINADLLRMAESQFPNNIKLDLIEGDVNELVKTGERWDIILCISALHHIVELERVIRFCYECLEDDGEFWSIGEYVGRNGNRLWPDARTAANQIFSDLPESKRINKHTSVVDNELPDDDYSVGCFEGIRSEDIEPAIAVWFQVEEIMKRNCFLWRLTNLTYSDNYDLGCEHDRDLLRKMVNAEVTHYLAGGQGTELFAVYRPLKRNKSIEEVPSVKAPTHTSVSAP